MAERIKYLFYLTFLIFLVSECGPGPAGERNGRLFGERLLPVADLPAGLSAVDSVSVYRGRDLYQYIDGGADLYLEYGFRETAVREYLARGEVSLVVSLYRMADPEAAFGIFSCSRRPGYMPQQIGTAGASSTYQYIFCKGDYYIEIQCLAWDLRNPRAMEEMARVVEKKLAGGNTKPLEKLNLLPETNLLPNTAMLVRGPLSLNSRHYLSDENLFSLSEKNTGVLGLYQFEEHGTPATVLSVVYPDSTASKAVLSALEKFYRLKAENSRAVFNLSIGRFSCKIDEEMDLVARDGSRVVAVFGAPEGWADRVPPGFY